MKLHDLLWPPFLSSVGSSLLFLKKKNLTGAEASPFHPDRKVERGCDRECVKVSPRSM